MPAERPAAATTNVRRLVDASRFRVRRATLHATRKVTAEQPGWPGPCRKAPVPGRASILALVGGGQP